MTEYYSICGFLWSVHDGQWKLYSCDSPLDVGRLFWHRFHPRRRGGQAMKVERFSWELEGRLVLSHGVNRPPAQ